MNRKHLVLFGALTAAGFVAGCGSPQISRIDKNRDAYETWPIETRQAVLDGKVEPGMTPEMVEVAWGKPTEVVGRSSNGADEEIWVYRKGGGEDPSMMGVYPGTYPGGYPVGGYPPGAMGGMGGTGSGVSIGTSRGGTVIGTSSGIGIGGGGIGMGGMGGMGAPIMTRSQPVEEKEVVFRNGVVHRADAPTP